MKKLIPFLIIPLTVLILYYPVIFTYFSQDDFFHFKDSRLSFFAAFFYAVSSAQISPLYYLAGGIQVLGATTFLLLTLILTLRSSALSLVTFILALGSHELTSITPFLISALFFVRFPFSMALKNIWKVLPFFLVFFIYLYLEITKIGFSAAEKQYQIVFNIKTILNSYIWYIGWALGLPEMLIDFVQPGFKLNPSLMKYWGSYYQIIFSTFFISLFLLATGIIYLLFPQRLQFCKETLIGRLKEANMPSN